MNLAVAAAELLVRVRERRPLIHHITNVVTINDVANATLALGALPVMAYAPEEAAEVAKSADALVLNLGAPTPRRLEAMLHCGRIANEARRPVILDPVGAGATSFRSQAVTRLLNALRIALVRGNDAELAALLGRTGTMREVRDPAAAADRPALAATVARRKQLTVAMTGAQDVVSDGQRIVVVDNGHPLMARVPGTGCMVTAVVAAFLAVSPDPVVAAAAGLIVFGVAGELAAETSRGPGTFKPALWDALYALTPELVLEGARARMVAGEG